MKSLKFVLLNASCLFVGCMSYQSQMIHKDNGTWEHQNYKGVPITLKVPTHIALRIVERRYLYVPAEGTKEPKVVANLVTMDVRHEIITTEKIFTVDTKRPAAGTLKTGLGFTGQYFSKIDYDVNDLTIQTIAQSIEDLIKAVAPQGFVGAPRANESPTALNGVQPVDSIVASDIFDLNDCDLEMKIRTFLHQHLNCAHNPCGPCLPPATIGVPSAIPPSIGTLPAPVSLRQGN